MKLRPPLVLAGLFFAVVADIGTGWQASSLSSGRQRSNDDKPEHGGANDKLDRDQQRPQKAIIHKIERTQPSNDPQGGDHAGRDKDAPPKMPLPQALVVQHTRTDCAGGVVSGSPPPPAGGAAPSPDAPAVGAGGVVLTGNAVPFKSALAAGGEIVAGNAAGNADGNAAAREQGVPFRSALASRGAIVAEGAAAPGEAVPFKSALAADGKVVAGNAAAPPGAAAGESVLVVGGVPVTGSAAPGGVPAPGGAILPGDAAAPTGAVAFESALDARGQLVTGNAALPGTGISPTGGAPDFRGALRSEGDASLTSGVGISGTAASPTGSAQGPSPGTLPGTFQGTSQGTSQGTASQGTSRGTARGTSNVAATDGETGDTTTVDLYDQTNSTLTIDEQSPPLPSATPIPEATNFVLDEVTYEFLEYKANATSYVMGGLLPITRNGRSWLGGVQYVEAFKCQLNILNSNTRILPVSLITYLIQNTDDLVSLATQQAYLLQLKNVFMNVGPPYDDQVPPTAYLYAPERLTTLSFQASSVFLANSTVYPSFFRTIPSDTFQARAMAETMRLFGWNFVAALFTTDTYGTSGRSALLSQTGRQRIKVTCTNSINPGSTSGLSSFADCVATSDASVVVLWMDEVNAANALSFLYRNATNSRLTFIASDRWANIRDPLAFNDTVARTGSSFPLSFINGTLGFMPQIGQMGQYRACASQVTPETADYPEFVEIWEDSFHCRYNDSDTLPPCPDDLAERTFECRCNGEEDFSTLPIDPLVNYVQDSVAILYNALDSLFNPTRCSKFNVSGLCNLEYFTPADFVKSLSLVSMNGLTGPIQFNQTQPDRRRSNFDIFQYRFDGIAEQVGFWNITGPFLAAGRLEFKTYPAYPTSILVPDNTNFDNGFWPKLVAILSGLGILLALAALVFFTIFASSRVVRRTNLLWLYLFIIGIILVFLACLLWTLQQTNTICTIKAILLLLGFALVIACIIVKVQRIFRVLTNSGRVSMTLGTGEVLLVVGLVLLIPVILIVLYVVVGSGVPQAYVKQSSVDNTYVFIACGENTTDTNTKDIVRDIFIGLSIFLVLLSTIFLLLARNLQTAYSEAEYLFLICIDILLLCAIMIPLYFTVGDRRGSVMQSFLLRSLAILFGLYLTLALLVFPKIIAISESRKSRKKRQAEEQSLAASSGAPVYAEVPTTEDSGAESDFTSGGSTSGKPKFISQTYTRASGTGEGSSAATPTK